MANSRVDLQETLRAALRSAQAGDFAQQAKNLLAALGYRSERVLLGQTGSVDDFLEQFPAETPGTKSASAFREAAVSIHVLFQVTDEEIEEAGGNLRLFKDNEFDTGIVRSFLFTVVELRGNTYAKGRYASFTREINKCFPTIPAVVLFRTASGRITLSFVHVRPNKRNPERNVIGSVSLIREIVSGRPHRAHLDILAELSVIERLRWMDAHKVERNFDGLLAAWLDALDTEELNRRFYRDLFRWFERAVKEARFPSDGKRQLKPEEHVIRLITRLLFVWFIKEKGLVAEDFFVEAQVTRLLKEYDSKIGDSYYRAVLQNLFFATLNTEIGQRSFSSRANATHRNFSRYRYREEMSDPDALVALFAKTPFINGGLFDCLDSEEATGDGGYRIDYFSDNVIRKGTEEYERFSIPNRLFFDEDGLITLLNHYKFTVEENTPAEQEVALDPELLGKVFENLLAAYNPETRDTARKQTGSYYTPRAVVDYMVDEALVASLAQNVPPTDGDADFWQERLRYLLDYVAASEDAAELFDEAETDGIVRAIARLRVLDPAVGSGAFPMGALHKLTLALRRLDPENTRWEALQKELAGQQAAAAFDTANRRQRDAELADISATFERYRDSDFGRKLYLIQNSIYGVDIQPVATQIAKLRFFISLAIEQQPTDAASDNYGIRPLPNLETRFVAANTLLGLGKATQIPLGVQNEVGVLQNHLRRNRERHFHAGSRQEKLRLRREDTRLRGVLARELGKAGMSASDAGKLSRWDVYDQNDNADWFDPEYMFGVAEGFDIVVGNPPYVQLQRDGGKLADRYQDAGFTTFTRTGDIYQLFYEMGFRLLAPGGLLSFITSNSWLKAEYGKATRRHVAGNFSVLRLLEAGKDVFENVIVDASILIARNDRVGTGGKAVDMDRLADKTFPPVEELWNPFVPQREAPWRLLSPVERSILDKMEAAGTPLAEWDVNINRGVLTGYNAAFIIDSATRESLVVRDPKAAEIIKPVLRGRDIQRFTAKWAGLWLIDTHNGYGDVPAINVDDYPAVKAHLDHFYARLQKRQDKGRTPYNLRSCAYNEDFAKEKLFWMQMSGSGRFSFADRGVYSNQKAFMVTGSSLKYLCGLLNSKLSTWFMKNTGVTTGMGLVQWDKFSVARIPIPMIDDAKESPFIQLIDSILDAKATNPDADTRKEEAVIEGLVYGLYGLTEEEIAVVEGKG